MSEHARVLVNLSTVRVFPTDEPTCTTVRTCHYPKMSVQYTAIFHGYKNDHFQMKNCNIFLIFAQNIDCGYSLEPPHNIDCGYSFLTSTHNLCFRAKIRK